jgi:hypothetical protein
MSPTIFLSSTIKKSTTDSTTLSSDEVISAEPSSTVMPSTNSTTDLLVLSNLHESIKTNQVMIQAIVSKLESHSSSLKKSSKTLSLLTEKFQDLHHIVTGTLPATFQDYLTQTTQDLNSDLSMALTKLSSQIYQELSTHRLDLLHYFKTQATTIAHLTDDFSTISKDLTALQGSTLSL